MDTRLKPIPALYTVYLLRSSIRHSSLYIGSTPNPLRRLAQHNGHSKGGAVRTSRPTLRPWEMALIVTGFPSNIAALQFEWAWHNAHLTRHIASDERISLPVVKVRRDKRTGKTRKKPGRPPGGVMEKLANLHLLLRSRYFGGWPLEVRFFSEDVWKVWGRWDGRVDRSVRGGIRVVLDLPEAVDGEKGDGKGEAENAEEEEFSSAQRPAKRKKVRVDRIGKGGIEGVDPTYARYRDVCEKSRFILDEGDSQKCAVCAGSVDVKNEVFTVCTADDCTSLSHITCLSSRFLKEDASAGHIPDSGKCPGCNTIVEWSTLMRGVSLRMRGEKEVQKLLKKKRGTKAATAAELMEEDASEDDEDEELVAADVVDQEDEAFDEDDDEDDALTVASVDSFDSGTVGTRSPARKASARAKFNTVIEIADSEDER